MARVPNPLFKLEWRKYSEYATWSDLSDDDDYLYWTGQFTVVRMRK